MPVYHIVLFKLKPNTSREKINEFEEAANAMIGQVPGLQQISLGPPVASTAHRSKGFDYGLVAILTKPSDIAVYAEHPAHMKTHGLREAICDDTLAYDVEFDG